MIVHYQNGMGDEKFIKGVIHLQNIEDGKFEALLENEKTIILHVEGIEGIFDEKIPGDSNGGGFPGQGKELF
jgi:hypothetical protein